MYSDVLPLRGLVFDCRNSVVNLAWIKGEILTKVCLYWCADVFSRSVIRNCYQKADAFESLNDKTRCKLTVQINLYVSEADSGPGYAVFFKFQKVDSVLWFFQSHMALDRFAVWRLTFIWERLRMLKSCCTGGKGWRDFGWLRFPYEIFLLFHDPF